MDAKAQKIIKAYADGVDGLTFQECERLGLNANQWLVVEGVLQRGSGGMVTPDEQVLLSKSGFSEKFIYSLSGADGKRALRERVKWLSEHCHCKGKWLGCESVNDRIKMLEELGEIGIYSPEKVVNETLNLVDDFDSVMMNEKVKRLLVKMGRVVVPYLRDVALDIWATNKRELAADVLVSIGSDSKDGLPELAYLVPELLTAIRKNKHKLISMKLLAAIGPEAKAAIPVLVEEISWKGYANSIADFDNECSYWCVLSILGRFLMYRAQYVDAREDAIRALSMIGLPATTPLIKALEVEEAYHWASTALVTMRNPDIYPLINALDSKNPLVRKTAANALGSARESAFMALPLLDDMRSEDTDNNCRNAASYAYDSILKNTP